MLKKEFPKAYIPKDYEDKVYEEWEKSGLFNPDNLDLPEDANCYSIVMPPPNVTGTLHMGHAAMLAIEDILIRFKRMRGWRTLWVPGTDHAAIATQTKVEKILKEEGITRHGLGREKFLIRVEQFAQESHDTIVNQVKKIGSSCDWSREAFTLDAPRTKAVRSVFKLMYEDGLIYRGERVVNWCPRCYSTLADDEVEYRGQGAKLYYLKYDKDFPIIIATTRPETKLGDTAIAVNPKDARYKKYIGKVYSADFCGIPLKIRIISERSVDMEFGTGAVGVTPAHSMADSQMAAEHDLDIIKVIGEDGMIRDGFGEFSGMTVLDAREIIVNKLREKGLIEKEENVENNLSVCYRCDTAVEPIPSLQWFINVNKIIPNSGKTIKELCLEAVSTGVFDREKIRIVPERFEKNYFHWMESLRDWCISRQIWYGHRIPVWYKDIPVLGDLDGYKQKCIEVKPGEPGSPVHAKEKAEFRFIIENEDDFKWLQENFKTEKEFESIDFFDGKIRTRVSEAKYIVIGPTDLAGVFVKKARKGKVEGIEAYYEEKAISGYARYEIEFKGDLPGRFKGREMIKSTDIFQRASNNDSSRSIYVGITAPLFDGWFQDEDTLDTWFSSGLWTFSTMAHAENEISVEAGKLKIASMDFLKYHPTAVLETGYDILFFWVARMILMTVYAIDDIPFRDVYLHGLVLDEQGKKMSKSKGNVIDPLDMIGKYGTDAARLSLVIGSSPGSDLRLSEEKIASLRNFINKIWNISRYIITGHEFATGDFSIDPDGLSLADTWILRKMQDLIGAARSDLKNYQFSSAGEKLKDFTLNDLADWYLESSKFESNPDKPKILNLILRDLLRLWHPFIPFVTETIWHEMGEQGMLMVQKYPSFSYYNNFISDRNVCAYYDLVKEIIVAIRNGRAENKVDPATKIKAVIYAGAKTEIIGSQAELIKNLRTGIEEITVKGIGEKFDNAIYLTVSGIDIYLLGAIDKQKEAGRLKKEIANAEKMIASLKSRLENEEFTSKAPEIIVREERRKLEMYGLELDKLKKQIDNINLVS
jgi:valyl-tRNA synthetase